jgi:hypothetical protein
VSDGGSLALVLLLIDQSQGLVENTVVVYKRFQGNFCMELGNNLALEFEREYVIQLVFQL